MYLPFLNNLGSKDLWLSILKCLTSSSPDFNTCLTAPHIVHATHTHNTSHVTYNCSEGYFINGERMRTSQSFSCPAHVSKSWDDDMLECLRKSTLMVISKISPGGYCISDCC